MSDNLIHRSPAPSTAPAVVLVPDGMAAEAAWQILTMAATPCYRCTSGDVAPANPDDGLCRACRGEVAANRADARDEVSVYYTGHGLGHTYRADVAL